MLRWIIVESTRVHRDPRLKSFWAEG